MEGLLRRRPGLRLLMEFSPYHLRKRGVDPRAFFADLRGMGFRAVAVCDERAGRLETPPTPLEEAPDREVNLYLVLGE